MMEATGEGTQIPESGSEKTSRKLKRTQRAPSPLVGDGTKGLGENKPKALAA